MRRDGSATKVVRRAPFVPMGSLTTWTRMSSPSFTSARMSSPLGAPMSVLSGFGAAISAACRNAVRSRPTSMNAACMPGSTRCTRPLYRLLTMPRRLWRSMNNSVSTPFSTSAARFSRGATLIRISVVTGQSRQLAVPHRDAGLLQQVRRLEERQSHDAGVGTRDAGDEHGAEALDRVGAGLALGLAAFPILLDFLARQRPENHLRGRVEQLRAIAGPQRNRGVNLVIAPRQPAEHVMRVFLRFRLSEDFV